MKKIFRCAWCLELNEIFIDITVGRNQTFTEDCQVCCRPNTIRVTLDDDSLHADVVAEAEG
jgi:hypothetical protein